MLEDSGFKAIQHRPVRMFLGEMFPNEVAEGFHIPDEPAAVPAEEEMKAKADPAPQGESTVIFAAYCLRGLLAGKHAPHLSIPFFSRQARR
jgi:hypothetical protein